MAVRKRRRKRKSRYHRGTYVSVKSGQSCSYRSGWELQYMQWLDACPTVKDWSYESVIIPYVSNSKTGKIRKYWPDFLVEYIDNHQELVEIKPSKRLVQAKVKKKLAAAGDHCRAHSLTLVVLTERELVGLGLLKK